ncbi:MAG: LysM peptidoglycan-binding domain-containing protein [Flavobacterium sp.]
MRFLELLVLVLSFNFGLAQNQSIVKHKVAKGETIIQISKKYNVTPFDIFKLNPDAQKGIEENTILLIPNKTGVPPSKTAGVPVKKPENNSKKHEVLPKETLYSIASKYDVSIEDIQKANPEAKEGLKIGMLLTIPGKKVPVKVESKKTATTTLPVFHEVLPKETLYSISTKYGISVQQIEKLNPEIANGLPIGFKLRISGENSVKATKSEIVSTQLSSNEAGTIAYVIKSKETLYSISNQYGITQEELIGLNPELKNGVQEGMTIKVPSKVTIVSAKKEYKDLTKSFIKTNKKLAILLPFNLTKLDQDTINSTKARLKKDKFLNMTLDFYSGALMAIDSVNKMGLNVDVTILDSQETQSTSNVVNLIQQNNLKTMDAIIGPFYQNNAEKTAELLNASNVPVISPLSKDYDKKYSNLIQATPSNNDVKSAIFNYMQAKNGNIIAVVDPKKQSVKQYITANHSEVQFVNFTETGALDIAQLKSLLVKDKVNFVIMETERTNLILSTTTALMNALADYQIRLVILGDNDALDYEEIQMNRLTKLKMTFPSQTKENDSPEANIFEKNFRRANKIYPNQFATRGFDITFDVLMRLAQEKPLLETLSDAATEHVENKFDYTLSPDGGYTNKGIYILYYDTDLTVKEAN